MCEDIQGSAFNAPTLSPTLSELFISRPWWREGPGVCVRACHQQSAETFPTVPNQINWPSADMWAMKSDGRSGKGDQYCWANSGAGGGKMTGGAVTGLLAWSMCSITSEEEEERDWMWTRTCHHPESDLRRKLWRRGVNERWRLTLPATTWSLQLISRVLREVLRCLCCKQPAVSLFLRVTVWANTFVLYVFIRGVVHSIRTDPLKPMDFGCRNKEVPVVVVLHHFCRRKEIFKGINIKTPNNTTSSADVVLQPCSSVVLSADPSSLTPQTSAATSSSWWVQTAGVWSRVGSRLPLTLRLRWPHLLVKTHTFLLWTFTCNGYPYFSLTFF